MIHLIFTNLIVIVVAMLALWALSIFLRDVSLIDPFWGAGFVIVAWTSWSIAQSPGMRMTLLACLTTIWGTRLALYLTWRNWGKGEDRRYAAMRMKHGDRFWLISLATVFLLQGGLMWFISLPVQVTATSNHSESLTWLDGLGIAFWVNGFFWEAIGDWQLACFKADPENAGLVMDRGLWRYTRHPNYFGDCCIWWGMFLISAADGNAWTVGSPLVMTLLLMKVSGVTLLENSIADRRPDYANYQLRTNVFFPGRRKHT